MSTDWSAVYRTLYPELVRFLHRKVWDAERAHDLAQEAFVRALRHRPRKPRQWLFQVAANLARDEARSVIRRKRHLALLKSDADAGGGGATSPDPSAEAEARERTGRVRRALEALSERDREALLLWDAGASYTEIAEHTGLAVGAVGTTLARARKRLAAAYHEITQAGETDVARG